MAYEISNYAVRITLKAGADLTGYQYCFVKLDSSGNAVVCDAVTDRPIGVLQNQPLSGKEASVVVEGGTKVKAGGAISVGSRIGTTTGSTAAAYVAGTDTTKYLVGTAIFTGTGTTNAASGDLFTAVVNCAAAGRGA